MARTSKPGKSDRMVLVNLAAAQRDYERLHAELSNTPFEAGMTVRIQRTAAVSKAAQRCADLASQAAAALGRRGQAFQQAANSSKALHKSMADFTAQYPVLKRPTQTVAKPAAGGNKSERPRGDRARGA